MTPDSAVSKKNGKKILFGVLAVGLVALLSIIAAELLDVEKKTASRLLSKAEKVEVLISKGKTKDKVYMKK